MYSCFTLQLRCSCKMECLDDQCYQLNQNNADIDEESHWHIDLEKKIMVNIVDQRKPSTI